MYTQDEMDRRLQKVETQNNILTDNMNMLVKDMERMAHLVRLSQEHNVKRDFNISKLFTILKCVVNFIRPRHPEFDIDIHQAQISDINPEK
jgi:hypothetical protein